jgi:hypothetical protein
MTFAAGNKRLQTASRSIVRALRALYLIRLQLNRGVKHLHKVSNVA